VSDIVFGDYTFGEAVGGFPFALEFKKFKCRPDQKGIKTRIL
jgi:hypothetical protein